VHDVCRAGVSGCVSHLQHHSQQREIFVEKVEIVKEKKMKFRLYITENALHSNKAIINLKHLLQKLDLRSYQLEILDIHKHSHLAVADKVQVVPTLLKLTANNPIRLIGDLANQELVKRKLKLG